MTTVFSNKAGEKFGKNFLKRESPTLRPLFLKTVHWSLLYCLEPLTGPPLRLISPESNSGNQK